MPIGAAYGERRPSAKRITRRTRRTKGRRSLPNIRKNRMDTLLPCQWRLSQLRRSWRSQRGGLSAREEGVRAGRIYDLNQANWGDPTPRLPNSAAADETTTRLLESVGPWYTHLWPTAEAAFGSDANADRRLIVRVGVLQYLLANPGEHGVSIATDPVRWRRGPSPGPGRPREPLPCGRPADPDVGWRARDDAGR